MDPDIRNTIVKFCLVYSFACLVAIALCGWEAAIVWVWVMAGVAVLVKVVNRLDA